MTLIAARRGKGNPIPSVRVTRAPSGHQVRIAFNAALVKKVALGEYVAIDHDAKRRRLTFVACKAIYDGTLAHKVLPDGGNKGTPARVVYVPRSLFAFLPAGPYVPTCRKGSFFIEYAP